MPAPDQPPDPTPPSPARWWPAPMCRDASHRREIVSRSASRPRRFIGVPPPPGWKGRPAVFGHLIGTAEAIPARGALLVVGPLRHHEVAPDQHAIERPGGGDQLRPVLGED